MGGWWGRAWTAGPYLRSGPHAEGWAETTHSTPGPTANAGWLERGWQTQTKGPRRTNGPVAVGTTGGGSAAHAQSGGPTAASTRAVAGRGHTAGRNGHGAAVLDQGSGVPYETASAFLPAGHRSVHMTDDDGVIAQMSQMSASSWTDHGPSTPGALLQEAARP